MRKSKNRLVDLIPDTAFAERQVPHPDRPEYIQYFLVLTAAAGRADFPSELKTHKEKINTKLREELYNIMYGEVVRELEYIKKQTINNLVTDKIETLIDRMKGKRYV